MFPSYRSMNSYPYQRNQIPSTQYYHIPSWDAAAPPQTKEDPSGPSFMYEPWPHNYGYPVPMQCHNCCNNAQYPPHYSFRPPCPQFPSPPAYNHFCGGYPAYPQHYPVSYVPPPHYTMELPRYEYDKSVPREFHCCGCPNHLCHVKEGKNVKIEEHEPETETKNNESLIPSGANNFQYPVLWIPPGYMMNKEQPQKLVDNEADTQQVSSYVKKPQWRRRPIQTEMEEHQDSPRVKKPQQSVQTVHQDPNVRYGWFPLDMDSIRQLIEGGDGRKTQGHKNETKDGKKTQDVENKDQNKQFPYPIFWIPFEGRGENRVRDQEEGNSGRAPAEEAPATFKVVPMKSEHPDDEAENTRSTEGDHRSGVGAQATEKASNLKTIPVKQLEESVPKPSKKAEECKEDGTPERITKGNANQESIRNGSNGQSSSSTKKSRLPPICLRVDPPKTKNGNGTSRSPSPPGDKKRQESDDPKAGGKSKELDPSNKEIKVTEAVEKTPSGNKIPVSQPAGKEKKESRTVEVKAVDAEKKVEHEADVGKSGDAKSEHDKEVQAQEPEGVKESKPKEANKPVRKILSETEAAAKIQSAYRGYEVRRWEPLKKLKQIAKVHEEAAEIKKHIEDLESRAGSPVDHREKAAVGETIMKLLLKLDTIQGLHPSIRDVRRSVAKDLIVLQDRLDTIATQKSTPMAQETAAVETLQETFKVSRVDEVSKDTVLTAEEPPRIHSHDEGSQGGDMSLKASEDDEASFKVNKVDLSHPPTDQDLTCDSEKLANSETFSLCTESDSKPQEEVASSLASSSVETKAVDSCTDTKDTEHDGSETFSELSAGSQESLTDLGLAEDTMLQVDMASGEHAEEETNLLSELPQDAIEDNKEVSETQDDMGTTLREEPLAVAVSTSANEAVEFDSALADKDVEIDALAELPQAVIEEDAKEPTSALAELPQAVIEEDAKEPTSAISSVETLNIDQEMEPASEKPDLKREELVTIEPESCKPDELSSEAHGGQESESSISSIDIDIPIEEQDVQGGMQGQTGEEAARAEAGILAREVSEVAANEKETELSPQASNVELNSIIGSMDQSVNNNEDALVGDQEKTEESESQQDQGTVHVHANINDQSVSSETVEREDTYETKVPQLEVQQYKEEDKQSQPTTEGSDNEEQLERKIIEENEKLRAMLEKLLASGKEQQEVISSLSGKVKDLEKKLARKKRMKSTKRPRVIVSRSSCGKPSNALLREKPMSVAS